MFQLLFSNFFGMAKLPLPPILSPSPQAILLFAGIFGLKYGAIEQGWEKKESGGVFVQNMN